jgi:hypothetical protein
MMQLNRKIIVVSSLAAVVILAVAFTNPPAEDPAFKNLKVLPKDINKDNLIAIMRGFNQALGVHCDFCHAPSKDPSEKHPDFVSDDKPEKNRARDMMRMTIKINKKFFEAKNAAIGDTALSVSCYTCHHGQSHPDAPKMNVEHQGPPPPPPGKDHN